MIAIILPIVLLGLLILILSAGWAILVFSIVILLCWASVLMEKPDE